MKKFSVFHFRPEGDPYANVGPRSDIGKAIKGRDSEFERWKEELQKRKPTYRNPGDISRATRFSPEEMQGHMESRGYPPRSGYRLDDDRVITEFTPEQDEEGRYLTNQPENIEIGMEGSQHRLGKAIELLEDQSLSREDLDYLLKIWKSGQSGTEEGYPGGFSKAVDIVSEKLNKVIQDLNLNLGFSKTNFLTNFNLVGTRIIKLISEREDQINRILSSFESRNNEISEFGEIQLSEYSRLKNELMNKDLHNNSQKWLQKLSIVYGGDIKIIADNPLDLPYPVDFELMMDAYKKLLQSKTSVEKAGKTPQEKWEQFRQRDISPVDVGGEESAERRKIITDIDKYQGLVSSKDENTPSIVAQTSMITKPYARELHNLSQIRRGLEILKEKLKDSNDLTTIDRIVAHIGMIASEYYSNIPFVTQKGKLDARFQLGNESRFAIYLGLLYIAKTYVPWREEYSNIPFSADLNKILEGVQGGAVISKSNRNLMKIAQKLDQSKDYELSDLFIKFAMKFI